MYSARGPARPRSQDNAANAMWAVLSIDRSLLLENRVRTPIDTAEMQASTELYLARRRRCLARSTINGRLKSSGDYDRCDDYARLRRLVLGRHLLRWENPSLFTGETKVDFEVGPYPDESNFEQLMSRTTAQAYDFVGMHHIFADNTAPVTLVKFANEESNLLAFCCMNGAITVATAREPAVVVVLEGHTQPVLDLDWSLNNELIVTCSRDKSLRVWSVTLKRCVRVVYSSSSIPNAAVYTCVRFHPLNSNILIAGTVASEISVINASTGVTVHTHGYGRGKGQSSLDKLGSKLKGISSFFSNLTRPKKQAAPVEVQPRIRFSVSSPNSHNPMLEPAYAAPPPPTAAKFKPTFSSSGSDLPPASFSALAFAGPPGSLLFAGTADGRLATFRFDSQKMAIQKGGTITLSSSAIVCLSFNSGAEKRMPPMLLVSSHDGVLRVYRAPPDSMPTKMWDFPTTPCALWSIASCWCPLTSFHSGACVVTGSEEMAVHIYDITKQGVNPCINSLQGHSAAVLSVSWAQDETLLASSDADGVVILWRRRRL